MVQLLQGNEIYVLKYFQLLCNYINHTDTVLRKHTKRRHTKYDAYYVLPTMYVQIPNLELNIGCRDMSLAGVLSKQYLTV